MRILPIAKDTFAKLTVNKVKNIFFIELIYFDISIMINKLINNIIGNKMEILLIKSIFENNVIKKAKKINKGNIGCKPLIPELYLIRFRKSIPKQDL